MKKNHFYGFLLCLALAGFLNPAHTQISRLISPANGQSFQTGSEMVFEANLMEVPLMNPTRLHVWNNMTGWRKLKLGNNASSLYSPKHNVLSGNNQWIEILMMVNTPPADWTKLLFRAQGAADCSVPMIHYIPANFTAGKWMIWRIPVSDFSNTSYFNALSNLEFPYSANAGNWDISIASIRFTGGSMAFEWLGPDHLNSIHDGFGKPGQVWAAWQAGDPLEAVIPDLELWLNGNLFHSSRGIPCKLETADIAAGNHILSLITRLNQNIIDESDPVAFSVTGEINLHPEIFWTLPSQTIYPSGIAINIGVDAHDPDGLIENVKVFVNNLLLQESSGPEMKFLFAPEGSGEFAIVAEAMDNKGATVSSSKFLYMLPVENKPGKASFTFPGGDIQSALPCTLNIQSSLTGEPALPVTYLEVSNPLGGYRKLKIGNNPDNLYSPEINMIEAGHDQVELIMKDFNQVVTWSRILFCPMEKLTNPVVLASYWNQASDMGDGWKRMVIPFSHFDPSIDFSRVSYLALPYSRDAGNFVLGIRSISFTGGPIAFTWFSEEKTNVKVSGSGGPGELSARLVSSETEAPEPVLYLTCNGELVTTTPEQVLNFEFHTDTAGTFLFELFLAEDDQSAVLTDSFILFAGDIPQPQSSMKLTLHFEQRPGILQISKAPLRYDKDFAYSFSFDDGLNDSYSNAFKIMNGGVAGDGNMYPGLFFTDGCGNDIPFTGALAVFSVNQTGADLHIQTPGYITWPQITEMYHAGWDVLNHTWSHKAGEDTDYAHQVTQNQIHVEEKTEIRMSHFVIPSGDLNYIPYAFDAGLKSVAAYKSHFSGYPSGIDVGGPVSLNQLTLYRRLLYQEGYTEASIREKIDEVSALSLNNNHLWFNDFTHRVAFYSTGASLLFERFRDYMQYVAGQYGRDGDDRIWAASLQEVYEYLEVRDRSLINMTWVGNDLEVVIDLDDVPADFRRYALSLNVDSDQPFTAIPKGEVSTLSYRFEEGKGLINIETDMTALPESKSGLQNKTSGTSQQDELDFAFQCKVFPNPGKGSIHLSVKTLDKGTFSWRLIRADGSMLANGVQEIDHQSTIEIPGTEHLAPGLYVIQVTSQKKSQHLKVMVQ